MIQYKAAELGIEVIVREESYTSKASALDFDPLPAKYQEGLQCSFSGKRVKRGLYRTKSGRLLSADCLPPGKWAPDDKQKSIPRQTFGHQLLHLNTALILFNPVL